MLHPLLLDEIRLQQDELRRRTATAHWTRGTTESRPRRQWWPRPTRSLLRLAFADGAARPKQQVCADC